MVDGIGLERMRQHAMLLAMHYAEVAPPISLRHAIKLGWTLTLDGGADQRVRHAAMPDGCVELIRRLRGRSFWRNEQPETFVVGATRGPADLQLSGDGSFVGIRLWPWAWNSIGHIPSAKLVDDWADLEVAAPGLELPESVEAAMRAVTQMMLTFAPVLLYEAILRSRSVAELARRSGRSHRWLQRWFNRNVGMTPRTYLRLLRFSDAIEGLAAVEGSFAGHAAERGFADQSHMSREFRSMAGLPATSVRNRAVGPFLDGSGE